MELSKIKEPIQKSIRYAIELINQFKQEDPKNLKKLSFQIEFTFKNGAIKNEDTICFINNYRKLFERNMNAFNKLYGKEKGKGKEKDQDINKKEKLIEILNYAKKINKDLNNLSNILENFEPNIFQKSTNGLKTDHKIELKSKISEYKKKYNDEKEIYLKEFKKRNIEILDITNTFLCLLIKLIKNIKKLSETLEIGYANFNESEEKFKTIDSIKEGKSIIVNSYREIAIIVCEINNIFIISEKTDKDKTEQILNKLMKFDQNLKSHQRVIYEQINQIREKYGYRKVEVENFSLGFEEISMINDDCSGLAKELNKIYENVKENYKDINEIENKFRIDISFILDTTSSMGYFIDRFKFNFLNIIEILKSECPEAIFYIGLIGYKDIFDKELGDDYLDYDFTLNYEKLYEKIEEIEPDGGVDIPEDIPGAFELALNKIGQTWRGKTKIAFLLTDSPCHGKEFHNLNQNNPDEKDEYPDGDPEGRDINGMIRKFVKNKISLFCFKLNKNTDEMYKIFKDNYNKLKQPNAINDFYIEKEFFEFKFIDKIKNMFSIHYEKLKKNKDEEEEKINKNQNRVNIINLNNNNNNDYGSNSNSEI